MSLLLSKRGKSFDWITFSIYIALICIGWLMIFSASTNTDSSWIPTFREQHGKQFFWIVISLTGFFAMMLIHYAFWRNFAFVIYFLALILLIAVLIFGKEVKGAQSWFSLGGLTFQPGEFAKLATALAVAAYTASTSFKITNRRALLTSIGLCVAPAILILLQPDAGTALVFTSFFILFYRLGLWHGYYILFFASLTLFIVSTIYGPQFVLVCLLILGSTFLFYQLQLTSPIYLLIFLASLVSAVVIADIHDRPMWSLVINSAVFIMLVVITILNKKFNLGAIIPMLVITGSLFAYSTNFLINNFLEPHQRERINVWLQPGKCDPRGSLYNVIQSKVAISSGGVMGKGFGEGSMTKLNYVPEQSTDFIFCTVGEEQGFIGVIGLLLLYAIFIARIFILSDSSRKPFIRNYGYILGGILFIHFFVNIGMTMGLVPIIGIPLPFLSYGGSSLIFFSLMVGIFLRLQLDDR